MPNSPIVHLIPTPRQAQVPDYLFPDNKTPDRPKSPLGPSPRLYLVHLVSNRGVCIGERVIEENWGLEMDGEWVTCKWACTYCTFSIPLRGPLQCKMSAKTFWKSVNVDLRLLRMHTDLKRPSWRLTSPQPTLTSLMRNICPLLKVERQPTR